MFFNADVLLVICQLFPPSGACLSSVRISVSGVLRYTRPWAADNASSQLNAARGGAVIRADYTTLFACKCDERWCKSSVDGQKFITGHVAQNWPAETHQVSVNMMSEGVVSYVSVWRWNKSNDQMISSNERNAFIFNYVKKVALHVVILLAVIVILLSLEMEVKLPWCPLYIFTIFCVFTFFTFSSLTKVSQVLHYIKSTGSWYGRIDITISVCVCLWLLTLKDSFIASCSSVPITDEVNLHPIHSNIITY